MKKKIVVVLLITASLVGCGGTQSTQTREEGVIEGQVTNAKYWIDYDGNTEEESEEPVEVTEEPVKATEEPVEATEEPEVIEEPDLTGLVEGVDYIVRKDGKVLYWVAGGETSTEEEPEEEPLPQEEPVLDDIPISLGDLTIINDGAASNQIKEVETIIGFVPDRVLQVIGDWQVIVTDKDIATIAGHKGKKYCGVTITKDKTIYLEATSSKFKKTVIHELGHALDYSLGFISGDTEFMEIYETEKDKFKVTMYIPFDNQHKSNEKEYFADSLQEYVLNPSSLESHTPKTYNYIKNLLDTL